MDTFLKRRFLIPGSILLVMLAAGPLSATLMDAAGPLSAVRIDLDGVLNSGFASNMPKSYLYVYDLTNSSYAYQWNSGAGALPWASRQELVNDLLDNTLNGAKIGDWRVESGGDPFHSPLDLIWKSISLDAGTYALSLTGDSRAYNLSDYAWPNETGPVPHWNAYVQIFADYGASFNFGEAAPEFIQSTERQALDYYRTFVDGMRIGLAQAAEVYFYINDMNSLDNAGGVSLQIQPVPEPETAFLLGGGLLALGLIKRRFRR
jgi:hypothetical protein